MRDSSGSQFLSFWSLEESSSHLQLPPRCSRCKDSRHQWSQDDSWCAFHPGKKQRSHRSCPDSNLINLEKNLQGTLTDSWRKFTIGSGQVVLTDSITVVAENIVFTIYYPIIVSRSNFYFENSHQIVSSGLPLSCSIDGIGLRDRRSSSMYLFFEIAEMRSQIYKDSTCRMWQFHC